MLSCSVGKVGVICFSALAFLTFAIPAKADLMTNGGFGTTTNGTGRQFETNQSGAAYTGALAWTSTNANHDAYNFIFAPGEADTTGANTGQYGCCVSLWSLSNGGLGFMPASSPEGSNFVAADGQFQNGAIEQTISGLTKDAY